MGFLDSKILRLTSVLVKSPVEFWDRALMIVCSRLPRLAGRQPRYAVSDWESVVQQLGGALGCDLETALNEEERTELESRLHRRMESLPSEAPFGSFHNGDLALTRLCYALVRVLEPEYVIETGVCYGVTTAFVLAALNRNRKGSLHSIDLPPLGQAGDQFVGWAIPDDLLKTRWQLHRGTSRKILPTLLEQTNTLGLFVHDSLHTYGNMRTEFELVWPFLRPGGVLVSDDIQDNSAFHELAGREDVAFHAVIREFEKDYLLGVVVKSQTRSHTTPG